MQLRRGHIQ